MRIKVQIKKLKFNRNLIHLRNLIELLKALAAKTQFIFNNSNPDISEEAVSAPIGSSNHKSFRFIFFLYCWQKNLSHIISFISNVYSLRKLK